MAGGEDSGGGGGGGHHDPTPGDAVPTEDGKRRLIQGEGFASRVSGTVRPQDPGGGATPVAAPRRMKTNAETNAEDTSRPECPCDDQGKQPLAGTNMPLGGTVSEGRHSVAVRWGGGLPPSGVSGGLPPVDVTDAPTLSVGGPRSVPSRISVVLVDGTMAGDTPGRECPREDGNRRPRAGETKLAGVYVGGGDAGLPHAGETLSSPDVAGRFLPVVPAGGPLQWVLQTLLALMGQLAPLARVGRCLHFFMTLWDR